VPLGLGGAPFDPSNLWPERRTTADGWNADVKDELEAVLARQVCSGRVPLAEAHRLKRLGVLEDVRLAFHRVAHATTACGAVACATSASCSIGGLNRGARS
jgi:hypothetical protein